MYTAVSLSPERARIRSLAWTELNLIVMAYC